jgi:hypothetical protein
MDPLTLRRVGDMLQWLAVEMQRERHPLAHVPLQLSRLVRDGGPGTGCRTCGGPVEPVRIGRPRVHCERCRAPRRADSKPSPKSTVAVPATEGAHSG